ncbi:MAG TPA: GEVED domain-containing protein, partial [Flavobacteriales bacterium]|nr:GEVED domain-containing protein [Flavobacteriales bacterium]
QSLSIPFSVPEGTPLGTTYLRVRCDFGAEPSACEDGQWGETEDYRVEMVTNTGTDLEAQEPFTVTAGEAGWLVRVGRGLEKSQYSLVDGAGREVQSGQIAGSTLLLLAGSLSNGSYALRLTAMDRVWSKLLFVVQ